MSPDPRKDEDKKTKAVSFRVDEETLLQIDASADSERRSRGEFLRLIFEYGFQRYQIAGSYDALTGRKPVRSNRP